MNGTLVRHESTSQGTFGIMTFGDLVLHTIERPWLNNRPFESCIPPDTYQLNYFDRPNGDRVFALTGGTVSLYENPAFKRYTVLIHKGNYMKDVVGCIAPGQSRVGDMVTNSSISMDLIMETVPDSSTLTITFGEAR